MLALGSATALNWSYVRQHGEASGLPPLSIRRPFHSLRLLFSNRRWLVGWSAGVGGWVLYVGALALAPLSLVQATSAAGIGLLALLASRASGVPLAARERAGVGVAIAGLALLAVSLAGHSSGSQRGSLLAIVLWLVLSGGAAGVLALAGGSRVLAAGAGLGLAAGTLYAAGDVATKAAVFGGARFAFVPVLLACHGLAFICLQLGFQRGGALATAGTATLLTNALPIAAGSAVFGEGVPAGLLGVARIAAFGCAVAGAAVLARPDPAAARSGDAEASQLRLTD